MTPQQNKINLALEAGDGALKITIFWDCQEKKEKTHILCPAIDGDQGVVYEFLHFGRFLLARQKRGGHDEPKRDH